MTANVIPDMIARSMPPVEGTRVIPDLQFLQDPGRAVGGVLAGAASVSSVSSRNPSGQFTPETARELGRVGGLASGLRKQRAARRNGRRGGRPRRRRLFVVCRAAFMRRVARVALRAGWRPGQRGAKQRAIEELAYQFGVTAEQVRIWLTAMELALAWHLEESVEERKDAHD